MADASWAPRDNDLADANKALTPMSEYYGVMIGQAPQTDKVAGDDIFRGYSIARRDKAPLIETEDFRDEAPRGIWDDYSPPHFGFKPHLVPGPNGRPGPGSDTYHWNSETFCLAAATRYTSYLRNRIDNPDPAHSKWSGYASIYFSDSDADGRQQGSEVLRVSGKVDGVRLPKELFYVSRVMQSEQPDLHIIGHWTYPANTTKTVYVAATHCDRVELFLNGKSLGVADKPVEFVDPYNGGKVPGDELGCKTWTRASSTRFPMSHSPPARSRPWPPRAARSSRSRNSRPRASPRPSGSRSTPARRACRPMAATWLWSTSRSWTHRAPVPDRRGAGRFRGRRPGHLARRPQQRDAQLDQQPLSQHRVRHQPRGHPLDPDARHNHAHGLARRARAGDGENRVPGGRDQEWPRD